MGGPSGPHKAQVSHYIEADNDQRHFKKDELHNENLHHKGNFEAYVGSKHGHYYREPNVEKANHRQRASWKR